MSYCLFPQLPPLTHWTSKRGFWRITKRAQTGAHTSRVPMTHVSKCHTCQDTGISVQLCCMTTHTHKSLTPASQPQTNSELRNSLNTQELQKSVFALPQATLQRQDMQSSGSDTKAAAPAALARCHHPLPRRLPLQGHPNSCGASSGTTSLRPSRAPAMLRADRFQGLCRAHGAPASGSLQGRDPGAGKARIPQASTAAAQPQRPGAERGGPRAV